MSFNKSLQIWGSGSLWCHWDDNWFWLLLWNFFFFGRYGGIISALRLQGGSFIAASKENCSLTSGSCFSNSTLLSCCHQETSKCLLIVHQSECTMFSKPDPSLYFPGSFGALMFTPYCSAGPQLFSSPCQVIHTW